MSHPTNPYPPDSRAGRYWRLGNRRYAEEIAMSDQRLKSARAAERNALANASIEVAVTADLERKLANPKLAGARAYRDARNEANEAAMRRAIDDVAQR